MERHIVPFEGIVPEKVSHSRPSGLMETYNMFTSSLIPSFTMDVNSGNFKVISDALPQIVPQPGALRRIAFDIDKGRLSLTELEAPKADGMLDVINVVELGITDDQKRVFIVTTQTGNLIQGDKFVDNAAKLSLQKLATGCAAMMDGADLNIGINVNTEAMKLIGRQSGTRLDAIGNNWSSFMLTVDLGTGQIVDFENMGHMSVMKDFVTDDFTILDGLRFQKVTNDEILAAIDNGRDLIDLFDENRFVKINDDVPHMLMRGIDGKVLTTDGLGTTVFKWDDASGDFQTGNVDGILHSALDVDGMIDNNRFVKIEGSPYDNTLQSIPLGFDELPVDAKNQFSQA